MQGVHFFGGRGAPRVFCTFAGTQHTHGKGVSWLVPYVSSLVENNPQLRTVVVDVGGPAKALMEERGGVWTFAGTKVRAQAIRVADLGATCSSLLSGVVTLDIRHIDQPQLNAAALSAGNGFDRQWRAGAGWDRIK